MFYPILGILFPFPPLLYKLDILTLFIKHIVTTVRKGSERERRSNYSAACVVICFITRITPKCSGVSNRGHVLSFTISVRQEFIQGTMGHFSLLHYVWGLI